MTYTEIKEVKGKKYYYRVKSIRKGKRVEKERKYLGVNLTKNELSGAERLADKELIFLNNILTDKELSFLKEIKKKYSKQPRENLDNRYEAFCSKFTYNSNAIEGSTLTLQETANLLFDGIVPAKSLREINEALNHKKALDFILSYKKDITKNFICKLHKSVVKDTLKPYLENQIGNYRTLQVYIRGVEIVPPKPKEVIKEMKLLLSWYSRNKNKLHTLVIASYFHIVFESIHPFVDGNGRVGRLLMNFILHKNNLPMINIPNNKKHFYYKALYLAQTKQDFKPFIKLVLDILKKDDFLF